MSLLTVGALTLKVGWQKTALSHSFFLRDGELYNLDSSQQRTLKRNNSSSSMNSESSSTSSSKIWYHFT